MSPLTPGSDRDEKVAAQTQRRPVSSEHAYVYCERIGDMQVVKCSWCGKYASYRLVGYKPEPPKEPCYGR